MSGLPSFKLINQMWRSARTDHSGLLVPQEAAQGEEKEEARRTIRSRGRGKRQGNHRQRPRLQGGCCRSGGSLDLPSERAQSPVKLRSSSSYTLISGEGKHHNLQKLNPKMLENQSLEDLFFG